MTPETSPTPPDRALVVGFGVCGTAVARVLARGGTQVVVVEDHPRDDHRRAAELLAVKLIERPEAAVLDGLAATVDVAYPSPGVPEHHPVFAALRRHGVPVRSELDLAGVLDARPVVAVTGTDGKTTVVSMVAAMLEASGLEVAVAGNTETPLVAAVARQDVDLFVVEASSFQLAHTRRFRPRVATWLNFGADHQDVHRSPASYEAAKARLWADLAPDAVVVANAADPVVMRHVPDGHRVVTFGAPEADYRHAEGTLWARDQALVPVAELSRALPHDLDNALAGAATAIAAGATTEAVRSVLRTFRHLAHRVEEVAVVDGVRFVDDSKATTPHATLVAIGAFDGVVLVAGGRNKGLDLRELRAGAPRLRAVVALGEAAPELEEVLADLVVVERASDMDDAVVRARRRAQSGDTVLLSPACASFDRYRSYVERGEHFQDAVRRLSHSGAGLEVEP